MGAHPHGADAARVKVELAGVFARHGAAYQATHRLVPVQVRAMAAIQACRTAALGGHVERCNACGALRYHYHSCRNRHCPKCQTRAKERWLAARRAELLPVPYFHLVFTLPHELNALAQGNPRALYALLFQSVSDTLIEFGANPRWLGGAIAATLVLHTWGQTLSQHLHLHCLIAAGALAHDGHWITSRRGFLFPVMALSPAFRGKFLSGLKQLFHADALKLAGSSAPLADSTTQHLLFNTLHEKPWVVYAKRPFAGPAQVLDYLGRYTHRVALSNHRLVSCTDTEVRFRYKDYAHGNRPKVMALVTPSSSAASCCMSCPEALCAFATTASSPTAPSARNSHKRAPRLIVRARPNPSDQNPSRRSGCARPISTFTNARTATWAACSSSARSAYRARVHRLCRRRREHPDRLPAQRTRAPAFRPAATALVPATAFDPPMRICHSDLVR